VQSILRDELEPRSTRASSSFPVHSVVDRFVGNDDYFSPVWAGLPVALWEDRENLYAEVDLPGLEESDVDVTVEEGRLLIRGERKREQGRTCLFDGRSYGRFERVIALPEAAYTDHADTWLCRGVLSIVLSKRPKPSAAPHQHADCQAAATVQV
jgi:HSP20 family molecular chaperone IbpA